MQAIAHPWVMTCRRTAYAAAVSALCAMALPAGAMEFDHTERIEEAAADAGCAVSKIGKGKKRSGKMVYRVTCDADGDASVREVACALNDCVFEDMGVREQ